jgi:hypothetical protein
LKHQDESNSERESIKPVRNIFKMSRVLVNTNQKGKKKFRKSGAMDKINDFKEYHKDQEESSETNEYEYSLSSQSSDEDLSDIGDGNGKKKKI